MTIPFIQTLEIVTGLLTGRISVLLCLGEKGGLRRGREVETLPVGGTVKAHITFLS